MMKTVVVMVLSIFFSVSTWADIPLNELYGLRDSSKLKQYVKEEHNSDSTQTQKKLGIAWHNLAVLKTSKASKKAYKILKPLSESEPSDYEVLAYLGSSVTMRARDSWNVLTKISRTNKGLAMLDKAVAKDKKNIVIRLVRINNSLALPDFINRQDKAKKDLLFLVDLFQKENIGNADAKGEVYLKLGLLLKEEQKTEEAKEYLNKVIQIAADSTWAEQAKDALDS